MAQVFLPQTFSMHSSPADLEMDAVLGKMYARPRGPYLYPGLQGLGDCMAVSDLVAACGGSGTGGCDPRDSQCVANQQAIVDYAESVQENNWGGDGPCIPPGTGCGFTPGNDATVLNAFMNNQPVYTPPSTWSNGPASHDPSYGTYVISKNTLGNGEVEIIWSDGSQTSYLAGSPKVALSSHIVNGQTITIWNDGTTTTAAAPAGATNPTGGPQSSGLNPVAAPAATVATATTPPATPITPMNTNISNTAAAIAAGSAPPTPPPTTPAATPSWFTDPTKAIITGVPNWALVAAGAAAAYFMMQKK